MAFIPHFPDAPAPRSITWRPIERHLFYITAGDANGVHVLLVSAESDSEHKAREIAETFALVEVPEIGIAGAIGTIGTARYLGVVDRDVLQYVGLLAS